ncbi:MAG TPA: DUF1667 domain-containing protein [Clostridiaceae bacterium]
MTRNRNLTCIGCPKGCEMIITLENSTVVLVKGNNCINGSIYAQKECVNPTRILTSTVPVAGSSDVLSVKTETDIPKGKLKECIELLKTVEVKPPIKLGAIIVYNIANTGINIVATKSI